MNASAKIEMTVPQFLHWVEQRRARSPYDEPKWELFDGIPEMQERERWSHGRSKISGYTAIRSAVARAGSTFEVALDSIGVEIAPNASYRPEVVVFPAGLIGDEGRFAPRPVIVVELLSPSTANKGLRIKVDGYSRVPSILHYLVVAPDRCAILHYRREGAALVPPADAVTDGSILLTPPGLEIDVRA